MRIKKLELVGFKSFKDRTVIHYDAGITGIVGPNGCGKSNIVDALVWVMGEMSAKHLRGSSMEDVIFAGADGYAPLGMAEVSLTLENDGGPFPVKYLNHSEIMVTRRLHRSGESEYLVNKESARLKDIQEIFMDTGAGSKGFSIIEQGAIGRIVTSKPEERRSLIEEAAGITKFKARKRESQRRLKTTEANLLRLKDIITELKRQLDSLQRQAQRAERYRKLKEQIEELDFWLASKEYSQLKYIMTEAQRAFDEAQSQEVGACSELDQVDTLLQTLKAELADKERVISDELQASKEAQESVRNKEKQIQELNFEIEQARRSEEMTGSLAQENLARKDILVRDLDTVSKKLEDLNSDYEAKQSAYTEKKQDFDDKSQSVQEVDLRLTDGRRELMTVVQAQTTLESRVLSLEEKIDELESEREDAQSIKLEIENQKLDIDANYKKVSSEFEKERQLQLEIVSDVENLQENRDQLQERLRVQQQELQEFKDKHNEVSSRLYGLEDLQDNFEGFQEGVKSVMLWQKNKLDGLKGEALRQAKKFLPIAEAIRVPQKYEIALESALGPQMQMVLSQSNDSVLDGVGYLKDSKSGRSSFYSMDGLATVETADIEPLRAEDSVLALMKDVITVDSEFSEPVDRLLGHVAVVESLSQAMDLVENHKGWTFVTLEGDVMTPQGIITGGFEESAGSGVLKRQREIQDLRQLKTEWAGKMALAIATAEKLEASFTQMNNDLESARSSKIEKEILVTGLKKDMDRAESELNNARKAVDKQQSDVDQLVQRCQERRDLKIEEEERLTELREKKLQLEVQCEQWGTEHAELQEGIQSLQEIVTTLKVESAKSQQEKEGVQREYEMLRSSLDDIEERLGRMTEETQKSSLFVSENARLMEERKVELEIQIRRSEEIDERLAQMKNDYEVQQATLRDKQESVSDQMQERSRLQSVMNEAQLQLEQSKMKVENLSEQMLEKYQTQIDEVYEQYIDMEAPSDTPDKTLTDLKAKISRIGDVNLSAIDEYDEIAERYEFLSHQYEDLIEAKEQLRKVIDRINRICSKRFRETFEAVNSRFEKVFPVLFGGGEAHLKLVEDPEKDEVGIDIISKPPGKKMQSVSLLSGGEKALTAVSLIFSIFLVKPSPYCLLDEVDAPLDDANVMRFNELVREMAKRSQIIVVTHNKYTMEVAEKLYGVTMEEKGVSKMVSVDLTSKGQTNLLA